MHLQVGRGREKGKKEERQGGKERKKERRKEGQKERKRDKGGKERHVGLIYLPFYQLVLDDFESIRRNAFPRASPSFRYHCLLELVK